MSGIMEQVLAELQGIRAALTGAPTQPSQPAQIAQQPVQAQQPANDPFAPATPATNGAITEAHVMALIEPHLDNVALKAGLSAVLQQMGIARLPEARPDQYPSLYNAFQGVIAQYAATPAQQPTSII